MTIDRKQLAKDAGYGDMETLLREKLQTMSLRDIESWLGISNVTVKLWAAEYGIKMRPRGGSNYHPRETELQKKIAELIRAGLKDFEIAIRLGCCREYSNKLRGRYSHVSSK